MFYDAAIYAIPLPDFEFQIAVMADPAPDLLPLSQRAWLSGDTVDLLDRRDYSFVAPSVVDDVFAVDAPLQFSNAVFSGVADMPPWFAGNLMAPTGALSGTLRVKFGGIVGANPIGCSGYDSASVNEQADSERVGCADCADDLP